jgi:hypothetical protein
VLFCPGVIYGRPKSWKRRNRKGAEEEAIGIVSLRGDSIGGITTRNARRGPRRHSGVQLASPLQPGSRICQSCFSPYALVLRRSLLIGHPPRFGPAAHYAAHFLQAPSLAGDPEKAGRSPLASSTVITSLACIPARNARDIFGELLERRVMIRCASTPSIVLLMNRAGKC